MIGLVCRFGFRLVWMALTEIHSALHRAMDEGVIEAEAIGFKMEQVPLEDQTDDPEELP